MSPKRQAAADLLAALTNKVTRPVSKTTDPACTFTYANAVQNVRQQVETLVKASTGEERKQLAFAYATNGVQPKPLVEVLTNRITRQITKGWAFLDWADVPGARQKMPSHWAFYNNDFDSVSRQCVVCGREVGDGTYIHADLSDNTILDTHGEQLLVVGSNCKKLVPAIFL